MQESRLITVTEVNTRAGYISGIDNFQQKIMISLQYKENLVFIPKKGEIWMVKKDGMFWYLDKRLDVKEINPSSAINERVQFKDMLPGDGRIELEGNLYINAEKLHINGQEYVSHDEVYDLFLQLQEEMSGEGEVLDPPSINVEVNEGFPEDPPVNGQIRYITLNDTSGEIMPFWVSTNTTNGTASTGTVTVTVPTNNAWDLLMAVIVGETPAATITEPTGWWTHRYHTSSDHTVSILFKWSLGTETTEAFTSSSGTDTLVGSVTRWVNVDRTNPISNWVSTVEGSTGTSHVTGILATTEATQIAVQVYGWDGGSTSSFTSNAGVERLDTNNGAGGLGQAIYTEHAPTNIQEILRTGTSSVAVQAITHFFALNGHRSKERTLFVYDATLSKWVGPPRAYLAGSSTATGNWPTSTSYITQTSLTLPWLPWRIYDEQGLTWEFRTWVMCWDTGGTIVDSALRVEAADYNPSTTIAEQGSEFCFVTLPSGVTNQLFASDWSAIPTGLTVKDTLRVSVRWREAAVQTQNVGVQNITARLVSK